MIEKLANEALELTQEIIDEAGDRIAGTPGSEKAADMLLEGYQKHCDTAEKEPFEFHFDAFLGFMKIVPVCFVVSTILLFFGNWGFWGALVIMSFAFALMVSQFVFYKTYFDPFFPKRTGHNVFGVIEPTENVTHQVIIAGHHDAVNVFSFLDTKHQKYYSHRIVAGIVPACTFFFLLWVELIYTALTGSEIFYGSWLPYIMIVLWLGVVPLYFFKKKEVTPGAGDNLLSSALSVKAAEYYATSGRPKNVRLIFASMDAEEAGLRGAMAFAKKHKEELLKVPTYMFNVDSIYDADQIQFLTKDINGYQDLSPEFAELCQKLAKELGYDSELFPFTFGGGGTDAAELARIGVETTTMIAMESTWVREGLVYHTSRDTVDSIQPEVVKAALEIFVRLVDEFESKE